MSLIYNKVNKIDDLSENPKTEEKQLFKILESENWLTAKEAASYLKLSKSEIYNMCSSGEIRYYKLGRRSRFRREDLDELLLQNRRGGYN